MRPQHEELPFQIPAFCGLPDEKSQKFADSTPALRMLGRSNNMNLERATYSHAVNRRVLLPAAAGHGNSAIPTSFPDQLFGHFYGVTGGPQKCICLNRMSPVENLQSSPAASAWWQYRNDLPKPLSLIMKLKTTFLAIVSAACLQGALTAQTFTDDFETYHDYPSGDVTGTIWDGVLNAANLESVSDTTGGVLHWRNN
jgi:hypothetical protein